MGNDALVRQSEHGSRFGLLELPTLKRLIRNALGADFRQQVRPYAAEVGSYEGLLLLHGKAVFPLPIKVESQQISLCQCLVTALIFHNRLHNGRRESRAVQFLRCDNPFAGFKRFALNSGTDRKLSTLRH